MAPVQESVFWASRSLFTPVRIFCRSLYLQHIAEGIINIEGVTHAPRPAMQRFPVNGHTMIFKMHPQGIMLEWSRRYTDMINIATASHRRRSLLPAGMRDIPQHDERCAAPYLLHAQGGIGITRSAAHDLMIETKGLAHVVYQQNDVIYTNKRKWCG